MDRKPSASDGRSRGRLSDRASVGGGDFIHGYLHANFSRNQRALEGLCVECGNGPPVTGQLVCVQCGGQPPAFTNNGHSRLPQVSVSVPNPITGPETPPEPVPDEILPPEALKFTPLSEMEQRPQAQVDWLVDGLLPLDGLSLWIAPPKVGKSTLIRCLAAAVAGNLRSWLGRATVSGEVLHLPLEERQSTYQSHYTAIGAAAERIHVLDQQPPEPAYRPGLLEQAIVTIKPALVIVDPLIRWLAIKESNDYSETTAAFEPYLRMAREHRTHFAFIHHSRKSGGEHGSEAMGSTGLTASVDTTISIKRTGGQRYYYAMGRDGVDVPETVLHRDGNDWITTGHTKEQDVKSLAAAKIVTYLKQRGGEVPLPEIKESIEMRRDTIVAALDGLLEQGLVSRSGMGRRGSPYCYSVSIDSLGPGRETETNLLTQ